MSDSPLFSDHLKLLTISDEEAAHFRAKGRKDVYVDSAIGKITVYVLPNGDMMIDDLEIYNLD